MSRPTTPNFFIIGAPKCGTTTVADWLRSHPDVFVPPGKEPHHFNKDHNFVVYRDYQEYLRLFARGSGKKAVGEASVFYLYSEVAVSEIEKTFSDAKYVVCLRNPVDMAVSLHRELRFSLNENLTDFYRAWTLSPERRKGDAVGVWCREPKHLDYQSVCSLGMQVRRLLETVPAERVHFILLDDLATFPRETYRELLRFLGLPDDGRRSFQASNSAKKVRWPTLKRFVRVLGGVRRRFPVGRRLGLLNWINQLNSEPVPATDPLTKEQRRELVEFYSADVALLGELLGRDLCEWSRELPLSMASSGAAHASR